MGHLIVHGFALICYSHTMQFTITFASHVDLACDVHILLSLADRSALPSHGFEKVAYDPAPRPSVFVGICFIEETILFHVCNPCSLSAFSVLQRCYKSFIPHPGSPARSFVQVLYIFSSSPNCYPQCLLTSQCIPKGIHPSLGILWISRIFSTRVLLYLCPRSEQ